MYGDMSVTFPSASTEKSEGRDWNRLDANLGSTSLSSGGAKIVAVSEPSNFPIVRP